MTPINGKLSVHPRVGVWIEISEFDNMSVEEDDVHPRVGVWIEIKGSFILLFQLCVHPRVGVWIEISMVTRGIR